LGPAGLTGAVPGVETGFGTTGAGLGAATGAGATTGAGLAGAGATGAGDLAGAAGALGAWAAARTPKARIAKRIMAGLNE